ncbi:MAG TPA: TetR/AcrR family transcriptional regulator [Spirochaetes bacterium]|nr:TetR/AcrR family transcriptional regulator [Spirochaetota bacterium]
MSFKTELETIRRSQIIEAALAKISEMGMASVTLEDIAKEAGLSKGGVAHYFSSKEALFMDAFREFFDRIFARSRLTMDGCADPLSKLLSFGWLYNWDDPDVNRGYPLLLDFMAASSRNEDYRRLFREWVDGWIALLKEAVEEGQREGLFRGLDPDGTARCVSSIYHGIAVRWYLDRESHSTEWAVGSCVRSIGRLLERGE